MSKSVTFSLVMLTHPRLLRTGYPSDEDECGVDEKVWDVLGNGVESSIMLNNKFFDIMSFSIKHFYKI